MKLANSFFYTVREDAKDEDSISGNLLVRSGMIKKASTGVYMTMPLGKQVIHKIENIVREEIDRTGAQELHMPAMVLEELYVKSGRRDAFGSNMFTLKDRYQKQYALGPTHEELFAIAGSMHGKSYKDFPYNLYQIQAKYRDETRPRYGLIRTREFTMKDAYSFDVDEDGLHISYMKMFNAYKAIFDRMQLDYTIVKADSGAMGGLLSEEFQALAPIGEDTVVLCEGCDLSSNQEILSVVDTNIESDEAPLEMQMVETPNAKTIEEVTAFFNKEANQFVKTLIYTVDGELYAFLLKGDRALNETKVLKLLQANEVLLASFEDVEKATKAKVGYAGPVGLQIPIVMDTQVAKMKNFICGANKTNCHYTNINVSDFEAVKVADIACVEEGDICPQCGKHLIFKKGIEVGNTFKLGSKYAEAMGLKYLDKEQKLHPVVMGSYGIGIERCMAAIVEQNHDENGIIWPMSVTPYHVGIVIVNMKEEAQVQAANTLYEQLTQAGADVLLDDRDERAGVKFKDMELIGLPIRITVGKHIVDQNVELKGRTSEVEMISLDQVVEKVMAQVLQSK